MGNQLELGRHVALKEIERRQAAIDALVAALERAQQDVNWMLNERKFLNAGVFDYIDAALALARKGSVRCAAKDATAKV